MPHPEQPLTGTLVRKNDPDPTPVLADSDNQAAADAFAYPDSTARRAVAEWLQGLKSDHTRNAYRYDLTQFADWMRTSRGHVDLTQVTFVDMNLYARHLREGTAGHPLSRKTVARRLSTVSALFKRLHAAGYVTTNPVDPDLVTRPETKTADKPTPHLEPDTIGAVYAESERRGPRVALIVALAGVYGLRASEITWLTLADITDSPQGCQLRVRGKGDTLTHIGLDQDTCDHLDAWMEQRRQVMNDAGLDPDDEHGPLIVGVQDANTGYPRRGRAITRQAISHLVSVVTKHATGHALTAHSLRKSTAVAMHRSGITSHELQKWGRWDALSTVNTYIDVAEDEGHPGLKVREIIRRAAEQPRAPRARAGHLRSRQHPTESEGNENAVTGANSWHPAAGRKGDTP